jgi:hypothetical protein
MSDTYDSHHDYMGLVKDDADERQKGIEYSLRTAFSNFIEKREVEVIVFSEMSALDLSNSILSTPLILKPLLACCNIAARAIERDLDIRNVNTYSPRLSEEHVRVIAGYIKPFLPPYIELPALSRIDRVYYIDKEIRKSKGGWEQTVRTALNRYGKSGFVKRMFEAGGDKFELDAASPVKGDIQIGIDMKRIEARRDIHKRCDEIVNKASKLRSAYPKARFGAVVYYPFIEEHINIESRLRSPNINGVVFASAHKDSIENAVRMLLPNLETT